MPVLLALSIVLILLTPTRAHAQTTDPPEVCTLAYLYDQAPVETVRMYLSTLGISETSPAGRRAVANARDILLLALTRWTRVDSPPFSQARATAFTASIIRLEANDPSFALAPSRRAAAEQLIATCTPLVERALDQP